MTHCGHIALSGAPNVGKSSLLNRLVGVHLAIVSPKAQATRLPTIGLRTEGDIQYIWHDLPGLLDPSYLMQERMRELALAALPRMDVILHLHPAADAPAPPFRELVGPEAKFTAPVLVVYTKVDLVHADRRRELAREALAVSSESGDGIEHLLAKVGSLLPEAPFEFDPEDVGTQPVRFFVVEYLREAAFELLGDELPYSFTAEVEEFREAAEPVYIRASLFAERESQKGMIIGRSGAMIKQIGSHARMRLEALLGQKVYLECRVKVAPRWRKNEAQLQRFGFPSHRSEEMSLPQELLDILVCPKSKAPLEYHEGPPEVLVCRESKLVYRVEDGIPIMLIEEATALDESLYPPVR